jgi:hypothetical protein
MMENETARMPRNTNQAEKIRLPSMVELGRGSLAGLGAFAKLIAIRKGVVVDARDRSAGPTGLTFKKQLQ